SVIRPIKNHPELPEIKTALETYATANGKYEGLMPQETVDWADYEEPQMDLMDLLCPPPQHRSRSVAEHAEKKKLNNLKHARVLGKSVAQTGRNLRTIIMEPKRLI
ncbi:MAG: hypothetical protein MMC33_006201, partial [Icmadophila ericetorum]|nr:hypothetical protein [Icmadophila ericetorum]